MRIKNQRLVTSASCAVLALGSGALYASAADDPGGAGGSAPQPAAGPEAIGTYTALERSEQKPPPRVMQMIDVINRDFDINPNDARETTAADGTRVWIIPAKGGICFGVSYADGPGFSCATAAEMASGQVPMSAMDPGDGNVTAHYLVAEDTDAVEVEGRRYVPNNNTVVMHYQRGATVTKVKKDGSRKQMPG